jgi:hypothetical protein
MESFKIAERKGYQVWARFDNSAAVYVLATDQNGEGYIGECDTRAEAAKIASDWIADRIANS